MRSAWTSPGLGCATPGRRGLPACRRGRPVQLGRTLKYKGRPSPGVPSRGCGPNYCGSWNTSKRAGPDHSGAAGGRQRRLDHHGKWSKKAGRKANCAPPRPVDAVLCAYVAMFATRRPPTSPLTATPDRLYRHADAAARWRRPRPNPPRRHPRRHRHLRTRRRPSSSRRALPGTGDESARRPASTI